MSESNKPQPAADTPTQAAEQRQRTYQRPLDFKRGAIDMNHGAGGKTAARLINELFVAAFDNPWLGQGDDGAALPLPDRPGQLVMATDGHVVSPLFFPGGDLGSLAVYGTINDVCMLGAEPLYLSASFILEEGFALSELRRVVASMAAASREAGVPIVTGDTKVVERGKGDGVFISTTGVGWLEQGRHLSGRYARVGDAVLISGSIGNHGVAVLSERESLTFETTVESDSAALHTLVADLFSAVPEGIRVLRDPTRGGLATTLNEIAEQSGVGVELKESALPIHPQVDAACELLGLDPLYVANEGCMIVICAPEVADSALRSLQQHPLGQQSAHIGTVIEDDHHFVRMQTHFGGMRVVDWLSGEQLPRIC